VYDSGRSAAELARLLKELLRGLES